jgi:Mlc titration factor MtfA (ptsG expression regulator)
MEIDDTVRVVISACAVRLVLHRDLSYFNRLTEIVVYPHDYRHKDDGGRILGEAHHWGTVVLSWPAVIHGAGNPDDGHATAAHEFAHVLDRAGGAFDGTPVPTRPSSSRWPPRATSRSRARCRRRHPSSTRRCSASTAATRR